MSNADNRAIYCALLNRNYDTRLLQEGKVNDWVKDSFIPWAARLIMAGTLTVNGAVDVLSDEIKKAGLTPEQSEQVRTYTKQELEEAVRDAFARGVAAGDRVFYPIKDPGSVGKKWLEDYKRLYPQPATLEYAAMSTVLVSLVDEGIITLDDVAMRHKSINFDDDLVRVLNKEEIFSHWKNWLVTLKKETGSPDPTRLGLDCDDYATCFAASVKQSKTFLPRIYDKKFAQAIGVISYIGGSKVESHQMCVFMTRVGNKFVPVLFDPTTGLFVSPDTIRKHYKSLRNLSI